MEKINILVSCTAGKNLPSMLEFDDYHDSDGECMEPTGWLNDAEALDNTYKMRAEDLYKGPGANKFRAIRDLIEAKDLEVQLWILSAGFGIVKGDTLLPGYDATFSSMASSNKVKPKMYDEWLNEVTKEKLPKGTLIMLPNSYLKPFKVLEELSDHVVIGPFGGEVREALGCSMIRVQLEACYNITEFALKENIPTEDWSAINPIDIIK